ncbi:protein BONZAI 1 isoform X1 [Amborella trichopoda]|uniref:protein BONZAI 1 isoform X1 n=1 Tax=Amborella trichopoda TaxID=13333 RepID=UPI0005D312A5|nr:protein BONZAI 1 isoform X1 [Amborella trichopoda]|eukprot:XP_011627387.1 protein BONZAI 1 isoform X1 [Amborella trichopoda]
MGGCFSDTRGGQQAVGTADKTSEPNAEANDTVDLFLRNKGHYGLYSQLEISLSASNLLDLDVFSKSDPMAVIFSKRKDGTFEEVGRTEVLLNTLNPVWITKLCIIYQFEMVQPLVFKVYDVDTKFHNVPVKTIHLDEQQFLGEASCTLAEIVTKRDRTLTLTLQGRNAMGAKNLGMLTLHAEEAMASKTVIEMKIRCSDLEKKDLFSKSDPFLIIYKIVENGTPIPICKTEVIKNSSNPTWRPLVLTMQQFGCKENPLIIECYDFNSNGRHELIGKVQKSMLDLESLHKDHGGINLYLEVPVPVAGDAHKQVLKSQLFVDNFVEKQHYSFLDYISVGFELCFLVAIDFTASNGNPRLADSLHYIDPSGRLNAYQQAIIEIGEVIQFYDSDKSFAAWGFGGRPIDGPVSHCFNLNGSTVKSEVQEIHGIMTAYTSALHNVSLAGPTLFGHVINKAAERANQSLFSNQRKYFVLLIITDGVITDLQETKDAIVRASDLPLSIIIVGVGGTDFKEMEILDADKGELLQSTTGRIATRDIVQFVPFREVHAPGQQISVVQSLLEELPAQFVNFMRSRNILPHPPGAQGGAPPPP